MDMRSEYTRALTRASLLGALLIACGQPAVSRTETGPAASTSLFPSTWRLASGNAPVTSRRGIVATDAPLATHVGVAVLARGGNAVDAAVATAFALAVVMPAAGNVGGGGFIVVHTADGVDAALDFREVAPGNATRDMYLNAAGEPTERSVTGHLAAGVPGSVAGLWEAHRRFGSRPWAELVAPAIALADTGFTINEDFAGIVRDDSGRLARFPASAALFLPEGRPLAAGTRWRNPDLAAVLRRVAEQGPDGFYRGRTADLIVEEMRRADGAITHDDLTAYRAKWREPVVFEYRGHRVISMPPPSSGGVAIAIVANILGKSAVPPKPWLAADRTHLLAEAFRRAFAVRNHFLGDPDFVSIPRERLLSRRFADSLGASISATRASPSAAISFASGAKAEGRHTTHFSVADAQGNAVGLTTTINHGHGSGVIVAGTGFFLNNEMDDFATSPGKPNAFGLVQGEANAIAPGKRMLSSMSPTIVLDRGGRPLLVTGASGGPTIISTAWQIVSNVIDYNLDIATAVSAPRAHHQHLPDVLFVDEGGLDSAAIAELRRRGHNLREVRPGRIGIGASILRRGDIWTGASDPRVHGLAASP
jgi:gamma-glutamyltranspeptidase/glutathione hydrolase